MNLLTDSSATKLFDPIHGFIDFDPIESAFVQEPYFQRLKSIHQLGLAYWVYPGGRSSRFEHTCGVMEIATRIFDRVITSPHSINCGLSDEEIAGWRRTLRFAALIHDLGHLPFSHHAEKALLGPCGHEALTAEIAVTLEGFFEAAELPGSVIKIALGAEKLQQLGVNAPFSPWESLLSSIITSDFCGADRIDYLLRDAYTTGLVHGQFDHKQLIDKLCIVDDGGLKLGIYESGIESIESLLVARYFMHKRLYYHPIVRTYAMHISHVMTQHFPKAAQMEHFLKYSDTEVLAFIRSGDGTGPHLDALRSIKSRFVPLEIELLASGAAIEEELEGIPLIDASYSTSPEKRVYSDFPVLLDSGELISCNQLSPLLAAQLLKGGRHWIFAHSSSIPALMELEPTAFSWKKN